MVFDLGKLVKKYIKVPGAKTTGHSIAWLVVGWSSYDAYKRSREAGRGVLFSATRSALELGAFAITPWPAAAIFMLPLVTGLGQAAYGMYMQRQDFYSRFSAPKFSIPFFDTTATFTMRQRAMAAMSQSRISLRSYLGQEASFFTR